MIFSGLTELYEAELCINRYLPSTSDVRKKNFSVWN